MASFVREMVSIAKDDIVVKLPINPTPSNGIQTAVNTPNWNAVTIIPRAKLPMTFTVSVPQGIGLNSLNKRVIRYLVIAPMAPPTATNIIGGTRSKNMMNISIIYDTKILLGSKNDLIRKANSIQE